MPQSLIDLSPIQVYKDSLNGIRNHYKLTQSEAIITWIVAIPSITVNLICLFNEFVNGESTP